MSDVADASPVRTEGLEINVMHDGVVVYQRSCNQVHYLNPTAALVLEFCDGRHTPAELVRIVGETYGLAEVPQAEVMECLRDLREKELVR